MAADLELTDARSVEQAAPRTEFSRGSRRPAAAISRALIQFDVIEQLGRSSVPALVLSGGRDQVLPRPHSEEIARRLPRSQCGVIAEAGHLPSATRGDAAVASASALRLFG